MQRIGVVIFLGNWVGKQKIKKEEIYVKREEKYIFKGVFFLASKFHPRWFNVDAEY